MSMFEKFTVIAIENFMTFNHEKFWKQLPKISKIQMSKPILP